MKNLASPDYIRSLEADVLARTLWGEARGEGEAGMIAVAAVILNRVARARRKGGLWWGNDVIAVCQKPYQFSCWNKSDPNFKAVTGVDTADPHFVMALRIAKRAVRGRISDPTGGATHYHALGVTPFWARGKTPCATLGRHVFYNIEE